MCSVSHNSLSVRVANKHDLFIPGLHTYVGVGMGYFPDEEWRETH